MRNDILRKLSRRASYYCAILSVVTLICSAFGVSAQAVTTLQVGVFDVTLYGLKEDSGVLGIVGAKDWTTSTDVAALESALLTWSNGIGNSSGRSIRLSVVWGNSASLGIGVLGQGGGVNMIDAGVLKTNLEYAWRDGGASVDPESSYDAYVCLNSDFSWNVGLGAPGSSQYDFTSVVMHEIGHALGFSGSYYDYNYTLTPTWGDAGWEVTALSAYDKNLRESATSTAAPTLYTNVFSGTPAGDKLYWGGQYAAAANGGARPTVYAPSSYSYGSSIYHTDPDADGLMNYQLTTGTTVRTPSAVETGMLKDMGWIVKCFWTRSGSTLNWQTAANWSQFGNATAPDAMTQVVFQGNLGGAPVIQLGGDRAAQSVVFDANATFTLGGTAGSLTLASGGLTRTAASAGTQTITRNVVLAADAVWSIEGEGKLVIAASIQGTASLTKTGTGVLQLEGVNTYTGLTNVVDGTLSLAGSAAFAGNSTVTLEYAGTLLAASGTHAIDVIDGTGSVVVAGSATLTVGCLVADSLTLGATTTSFAAEVPEPSGIAFSLAAITATVWRFRKQSRTA